MLERLSKYTLLYIEDDDYIRQNAVEFLEEYFHEIYEAADAKEALEIFQRYKPDIVITDIEMPEINGLELCKTLRQTDAQTPIIVISAFTDTQYLLEAVGLGLVKYLVKPVEEEELFDALQLCAEQLEKRYEKFVNITPEHRYDPFNKLLLHHDKIIKLTHNESKLLELLVRYKERIVTYNEIENFIYYDKGMSEDALKALVRSLRKKLTKESIQNHSKIGYKLHIDV